MEPLLAIKQVSKQRGTRTILNRVSLDLSPGEVLGLADRSGAGKVALIEILAGFQAPDAGQVIFRDQVLAWPFRARQTGISIIHEEPALVDGLDVTANIFLGHEINWNILGRWVQVPNHRRMTIEAARLLHTLDARVTSLNENVRNLSGEQRQLIAIAKVMAQPSELIVVQDPDRYLSLPYQENLLGLMRTWQREGKAVLFSSTNLDHLFAVSDRIAVLRDGALAADLRTDETTREEVVAALVGTAERQQLTPVIWALDSYYRARKQAEILRHNQLLLERDLAAQGDINRQLLNQLADQVKALDSANLALQDAQRRLLTEREEERKHLARELHDQMIQDLLSLNYRLEEISEMAGGSPEIQNDFRDLHKNVRTMVEDLREICGNLRPPTIDSMGLGAALQSHTREWSHRTGIEIRLSIDKNFSRLPEAIELSIFRIVQEGLNNVWKHANASRVSISLRHTSPRMLLITLADDGVGLDKGFDLAALGRAGHYGILGISERVALMGGRLNFRNARAGGLLLQAEIPHPRVKKSDYLYPESADFVPR